jgi:ABC-type lipoprotein release transport system permease subunit
MAAIRVLARAELRRRWKAIVALTLLMGVVGAVVLASVAGARRTATTLDRFGAWSRAADLELNVGDATPTELREFRRSPGVAAVGELRQLALLLDGADGVGTAGAVDRAFGRDVDRARVIRGRQANPAAPLEIEFGESLAADLGVDAGDSVTVHSLSPAQVASILENRAYPDRGEGPELRLEVVGIVRRPLDLGVRGAANGVVVPTGVVIGRRLWSAHAEALGVLDVPRVPWFAIAVIIPAVIVLANLIAALPARAAARMRPALVLRSE